MAIQGVDPGGSSSLHITPPASEASQTAAQKFSEARAEARAGINDGDEQPGVGATVNKLA